MKRNKKGFTIIELVVVIAVIAILAAVLIPTFSSIIKKANTSADIQAVQQINTLLAVHAADGSVTDVSSAIRVLSEENLDIDDYKALQTDHYFYFVMNGNTPMVVYTDKDDNVLYPTNVNVTGKQLMSLTGEIPTADTWTTSASSEGGTKDIATIASGEEFADFMSKYRDGKDEAKDVTTIKLSGNIDLKGSTETLGDVTKALTIDGSKGGNSKDYYTISGLRADTNTVVHTYNNNGVGKIKYQCFGLINKVAGGTVVIKNVNISGFVTTESTGGEMEFGRSAVLIGNVYGKSTITIENVNIDNCVVYGGDKAGALIGGTEVSAVGSTITIKNVTVTNTKVLAAIYAAKVIGAISGKINLTFENCDFEGVTVGVNESACEVTDVAFADIPGDTAELFSRLAEGTVPASNTYDKDGDLYWGITTEDYYWYGYKYVSGESGDRYDTSSKDNMSVSGN